jgi:antitoxin component of MazEF toxin-antitoxin module
MTELKIIELGDSLGFVFPEELISKHGLKEGDEVILTKDAQGFRLMFRDAEVPRPRS